MSISGCFKASMLIAAILACLCGCSIKSVKDAFVIDWRLSNISIYADNDSNDGYPVSVDFVFVLDSALMETMSKLKASEWFTSRENLQRQNKNKLNYMSWEVVPGQSFVDVPIPSDRNKNALGVLVFSDYIGEASYGSLIQAKRQAVVRLHRLEHEVHAK